jgi:hypothetical protein
MKTMKRSGLGALLALALAVVPASGQDVERDCRCVDADGNEIERCTCFTMPDVQGLIADMRGSFGRPRLGVSIDPAQAAERDAEGALVTDVMEGGPAADAGLEPGDVITRVDGVSLTASMGVEAEEDFDLDSSVPVQRLLAVTRELEPGESVEVEYLRDGQLQTTVVEVEDLSGRWGRNAVVAAPGWDQERFREQLRSLTDGARTWHLRRDAPGGSRYRLRVEPDGGELRFFGPGGGAQTFGEGLYRDGLRLTEVNPGLGAYFGTEEGVLVLDVERGSPLGLQAGDVVLRIGSRDVTSPERFRRVLASYGDDEDIEFHVLRDGSEITVTGRFRY